MKERKRLSRALAAFISLVLLCGLFTVPVLAAESYVPDGSVAIFATDRHDNTTIIGEVLSQVTADGYNPGLVALGGDMVGDGPDIEANDNYAPAVNTSVVQSEVHAALSADVQVAILMASHDRNMVDDAGVLVDSPSGFAAGEYYVYIVPEAYMDNEEAAQTASEEFIAWAESGEVDASKPLVVLSHMPIHHLRGDNLGGAIWHEAINSVATAGGEEPVRNVFFFHGHNHTVDPEEYYYPVGSSIAIQGLGEDGQSEGVIQYTYITAGYLNKNGDATLLRVEEEQIVVDKYSAEGVVELGIVERLPAKEAEPEPTPSPDVSEEPEELPSEKSVQPEQPAQPEETESEAEAGAAPWGLIVAAAVVIVVIIAAAIILKRRKK